MDIDTKFKKAINFREVGDALSSEKCRERIFFKTTSLGMRTVIEAAFHGGEGYPSEILVQVIVQAMNEKSQEIMSAAIKHADKSAHNLRMDIAMECGDLLCDLGVITEFQLDQIITDYANNMKEMIDDGEN